MKNDISILENVKTLETSDTAYPTETGQKRNKNGGILYYFSLL